MNRRSCFAVLLILGALAGCQSGSHGGALPTLSRPTDSRLVLDASALKFMPLGPTHMSDGFPASGKVNAVAIDPANPKIVYTAGGRGTGLETYSSAGILRSTDGGASWEAVNNGLTDGSGRTSSVVNSLWIDPLHPSILLAATEYDGIFRSSDGGGFWVNVERTTHATQFASYGAALFASGAAGILTSADAGLTWSVQLAGTPSRYPTALGSVEGKAQKAFYAGMSDGTVFAFAEGRWNKVGTLPYVNRPRVGGTTPAVHEVAVDPYRPQTVYASTNDGTWDQDLHASTDGGRTWNTVLAGRYRAYGLGTQAIAFSIVHPHRLYLGEDGGFYYMAGDGSANPSVQAAATLSVIDIRDIWPQRNGSDDACWIASDQGLDYEPTCSFNQSRNDDVFSKTAAIGLARRFTVSPDQKTLLVSLQDFGSHLTSDAGKSWLPKLRLYEDGFNELRPGSPNDCYAYDEINGLSISTDGCRSFQTSTTPIAPSRLMTTPVAFDHQQPLTMYLASGTIDISGNRTTKGLFRSTNGGQTASRVPGPFIWPGTVVVDPANAAHIVVGDKRTYASALFVTDNGGKTWAQSSGVVGTKFWYAVTISPAGGKTVLASSVDEANNVFVLRSTDGGHTFVKVAVVTNAPPLAARMDRDFPALGDGEAFVYSPEREIRYNQDVSKATPDVALTTLNGAYLSSDNGSTWTRIDGSVARSFWGIRWVDGYLYLASDGRGVLRSTTQVQKPSATR